MNNLLSTITKTTLGFAVALVVVAFVALGVETGIGALTGAGVAVLNWGVLRWTLARIVDANVTAKAGLTFLLSIKLAFVGFLAFVAIRRFGVDPLGFMLGFGALVFGILTASLLYTAPVTAAAAPAGAAPGNDGEEL